VVNDIARIALESDALIGATLTLMEPELAAGSLVVVPIATPWFQLRYGVIARKRRTLSAAASAFAEQLRQAEGELERREAAHAL